MYFLWSKGNIIIFLSFLWKPHVWENLVLRKKGRKGKSERGSWSRAVMQTYCGAEGIIAGLRRCGATLNGISGAARIGRNVVEQKLTIFAMKRLKF